MFKISIEQTVALAGLYQSLALVQKIAWQGDTNHSSMLPTISSIFNLNPERYIDVYGSVDNLQLGVQTLKTALQNKNEKHAVERTRYAINLMYLASKLAVNNEAVSSLGNQIERLRSQYEPIDASFDEVTQELGTLYREHISPLGPKIIIQGDPVYLKTGQNASTIRALLLAGIRSIVLWRQANGKRWALLLGRKSLLESIVKLESGFV